MIRWGAIGALLILVAFLVGRYTSPSTVITETTETVAAEETSTVEAEVTVEETAEATIETTIERVVVTTSQPDGATVTVSKETEHRLEARTEEKTTEAELTSTGTVTLDSYRTERQEDHPPPTVSLYPSWRVGVSVGLALREGGQPTYGVEVDRRLVGPLYVGVRVDTAGVVRAALSVTW